jgi:hypothetical protein
MCGEPDFVSFNFIPGAHVEAQNVTVDRIHKRLLHIMGLDCQDVSIGSPSRVACRVVTNA